VSGFFTIAKRFSTPSRRSTPYNDRMTDLLLTDRREAVIDRLSSDYANGAFEVDELERRLALVHAAQTPADLDALVTDLAPRTMALVPSQRVRVVMGSVERTGPWTVPQRVSARVFWGHLLLDLRDARLAPGTTIDVNVTMGNVEVVVPPGVTVDVDASSFMGAVEDRTERATTPGATIRIVGRVKLGNLEVETRRSGETKRDARRRRRFERRVQRRWRRALPSLLD
jgi:hypothetical protein